MEGRALRPPSDALAQEGRPSEASPREELPSGDYSEENRRAQVETGTQSRRQILPSARRMGYLQLRYRDAESAPTRRVVFQLIVGEAQAVDFEFNAKTLQFLPARIDREGRSGAHAPADFAPIKLTPI